MENVEEDPAPPTYSFVEWQGAKVVAGGVSNVELGPDQESWVLGADVASVFILTTTAVVSVVAQEGSIPWWMYLLANASGGSLTLVQAPPSPVTSGFDANAAQLQQDYTVHQEYVSGNLSSLLPDEDPISMSMAVVLAKNPDINEVMDGGYGTVYITPTFYQQNKSQLMDADGYAYNGYTGEVHGTTTTYNALIPEGNWDLQQSQSH